MLQRHEELDGEGQQPEHGPLEFQHAHFHNMQDDEALQENAERQQQLHQMASAHSDQPEHEQNTDPNINMDQLYENMRNCQLNNYT